MAHRIYKEAMGEDFNYMDLHADRVVIAEAEIAKRDDLLMPGVADTLAWLKEKEIPMAVASSTNLEKTVAMPAFSEDLDIVGDRVIVSFESACNKYIVGKLFFTDKVISYPLS